VLTVVNKGRVRVRTVAYGNSRLPCKELGTRLQMVDIYFACLRNQKAPLLGLLTVQCLDQVMILR